MIQILYFASLRETLGSAGEQLTLPSAVTNVAALIEHLCARGGAWAQGLGPHERLLVAVNQEFARPDTPLHEGDEVALFPPVTGG